MLKFSGLIAPVPLDTMVSVRSQNGSLSGEVRAHVIEWSLVRAFEVVCNGDWIVWAGGDRSVFQDVNVEVVRRGGKHVIDKAGEISWRSFGDDDDVVSYRVVRDDYKVNLPVEQPPVALPYPMPPIAPAVVPASVVPPVSKPVRIEWDGKTRLMTYTVVKQGLIVYVGAGYCCVELSPGDATMMKIADIKPVLSKWDEVVKAFDISRGTAPAFDEETTELLKDMLDYYNDTVTLDR